MRQPEHTSSAPSAQAPTRRSEGWPPWGFERGSLTAVVFTIGAVGWLVARSAGILASAAQISIYLIANLILTFDAIDSLWVPPMAAARTRRHVARPIDPISVCQKYPLPSALWRFSPTP